MALDCFIFILLMDGVITDKCYLIKKLASVVLIICFCISPAFQWARACEKSILAVVEQGLGGGWPMGSRSYCPVYYCFHQRLLDIWNPC